jgi:hypothetical protein
VLIQQGWNLFQALFLNGVDQAQIAAGCRDGSHAQKGECPQQCVAHRLVPVKVYLKETV